jgi:hypothetical protein
MPIPRVIVEDYAAGERINQCAVRYFRSGIQLHPIEFPQFKHL